MAATLAFVEGHSPDMNLLAFQRTGELNRIGRDSPHQICSLTHLAGCRFTRACFSTHYRLFTGALMPPWPQPPLPLASYGSSKASTGQGREPGRQRAVATRS